MLDRFIQLYDLKWINNLAIWLGVSDSFPTCNWLSHASILQSRICLPTFCETVQSAAAAVETALSWVHRCRKGLAGCRGWEVTWGMTGWHDFMARPHWTILWTRSQKCLRPPTSICIYKLCQSNQLAHVTRSEIRLRHLAGSRQWARRFATFFELIGSTCGMAHGASSLTIGLNRHPVCYSKLVSQDVPRCPQDRPKLCPIYEWIPTMPLLASHRQAAMLAASAPSMHMHQQFERIRFGVALRPLP